MATDEHTIKLLSAARAPEEGSMGVAYRELRARLFERQQAPPRLGRYSLQEHVGAGGMGTVFRAHDPELDRTVAIKLVKSSAVTESSAGELQAEARALARVEHPNVVPVHDLGRYDRGDLSDHAADVLSIPTQGIFIVMRWIDGAPLKRWLAAASPSRSEILQLFEAAGSGLHHVHTCGLVHQDFKPGNVLVDSANAPHVLDFGIAQVEAQRDPTAPKPKPEDFVRGTPRYMAPEQNRGEPADSRSDQYAFAICLVEALTGRAPIAADDPRQLGRKKAKNDFDPRAMRALPRWLAPVLRRAMDANPDARFDTMAALLGAITTRRRRREFAAWGMAAAVSTTAIVGVSAATAAREDACGDAAAVMDTTWTPERSASVRDGLAGQPLPSAAAAGAQAVAALDAFAASWSEARTEACQALLLPEAQTASEGRLLCLDRMLHSFEASVDVLEHPDPSVVLEVGAVVHGLPEPQACENVGPRSVALLLPAAAPKRAAAQRVVAALERSNAQGLAGRLQQQLEDAQQAHDLSLSVGHDPLSAAAAARLARALWDVERPQDALPLARRALARAEAAGDVEQALRIQVDLVGMLGASLRRYDEALGLAIAVEARCQAVPDPRVFLAPLRHNVGRTRLAQGDAVAGLSELERALQLRRGVGDDGPGFASNLNLLGAALSGLNRPREAMQRYEQALNWQREHKGEDHPDVATALNNLAIAHVHLGDLEVAKTHYEDALGVFERSRGSLSKDAGMVLNNLGGLLHDRGELGPAETALRKALEAKRASVGDTHSDMGYSWVNLGRVLRRQGELEEADRAFRSAVENWGDAWGAQHPLLSEPLLGQAEVALDRGDLSDAESLARRALAQMEHGTQRDPERTGRIASVLAQATHALAPKAAEGSAREALAAFSELSTPSLDQQDLERWMLSRGLTVPSADLAGEVRR